MIRTLIILWLLAVLELARQIWSRTECETFIGKRADRVRQALRETGVWP